MHFYAPVALLFALAICSFSSVSNAQEWTRFRGPNGTGESECKTIPAQWTDQDILWKATIPGVGHSSPVIWGDKVFVLSAEPGDATRYCLCYGAADGKQKWKVEYKSQPHHLHPRSSFASSTPTVDDSRVYFAWSMPGETTLLALDHNGKEVWRKNLGPWASQHGYGTSPILYQDMVIVNNAQDDELSKEITEIGKSFVLAFNKKTGEEIWRTPIKSGSMSYSVPFINELAGGKAEIVCTNTGNGVYALDILTGKTNWSVANCFAKMRTVSSPVMAGGLVFGSCGSGADTDNAVVAVRPGPSAELVYKLKNSSEIKAPYVPSLVKRGDLLFLLHDKGFAACVDAKTGQNYWSNDGKALRMGGAFSGSPIRVDDKIYCIDEDGVVWVIAAEKEFKVLGKNPLGEPSRSTPAVSDGKMFLRTYSQLVCVGKK